MRAFAAFLLGLGLCPAAAAQTTVTDATVGEFMGVGTYIPRARFHVQASSQDAYGLILSSADGRVMVAVDAAGRTGLEAAAPEARLTVGGAGDAGEIGTLLRAGGSSVSVSGVQVSFSDNGQSGGRHGLKTRSSATALFGNGLDFTLWRSTGQPSKMGSDLVLSIEAGVSGSSAGFHVVPATSTASDAEVEVSDGLVLGGGVVRYLTAGTHSSRKLKSDVQYLDSAALDQALADIEALKPVRFSYRGSRDGRRMRGVLFEEAPASIRGAHDTVVLDERLLNLELALQAIGVREKDLEERIRVLERTGR